MNQYDYRGSTNQGIYTTGVRAGPLTVTPMKVIIQQASRHKEIPIHEITSITFVSAGSIWLYMLSPLLMLMRGKMTFSYHGATAFDLKSVTFTRKQEPGILEAKAMID